MDSASIVVLIMPFLTAVSVLLSVKYRQGLRNARLFAQLFSDIEGIFRS